MARLGLVGSILLAFCACPCAWAEEPAEVIEPDPALSREPKPVLPPVAPLSPVPVSRMPLVIDEPGFKASATFPQPPSPIYDQNTRPADLPKPKKNKLSVPQEEGPLFIESGKPIPESAKPDETEKEKNAEEISPALAKAIAKEHSGTKPKEMVPIYQAVASAEPDKAAPRYYLGLAMVRNGEMIKGLAELEKAVLLQPEMAKYTCDYGLAALQAGWLEKAYAACLKASMAAPANARFQSALGDVLMALERIPEAAEVYTRAVHLAPTQSKYMFNLGLAHMHARAYKRAIEIFDEAIKTRNDYSPYYCSRGLARENLKDFRGALEDYALAIKLDKNNAYAHYLLAGIYSDPEDPTYTNRFAAIEQSETAVKLTNYKNAQYLMGLARALRTARNYDQAIDVAKKAVELEPSRADYRRELGGFERLKTQGFE